MLRRFELERARSNLTQTNRLAGGKNERPAIVWSGWLQLMHAVPLE
jgi:hypothetical protein